jgi:hypothetical protein
VTHIVEVTIRNSDDDRVMRYDAEFDDLEITESLMTGELSFKPGRRRVKSWGGRLVGVTMPLESSPWRKVLEGDWAAEA